MPLEIKKVPFLKFSLKPLWFFMYKVLPDSQETMKSGGKTRSHPMRSIRVTSSVSDQRRKWPKWDLKEIGLWYQQGSRQSEGRGLIFDSFLVSF